MDIFFLSKNKALIEMFLAPSVMLHKNFLLFPALLNISSLPVLAFKWGRVPAAFN